MTAFLDADPAEPFDAATLGRALGNLNAETVRQLELHRELFSILRSHRTGGREYRAFQAWRGIQGAPLTKVLAALRNDSGTAAYGFFTSPNPDLLGLTPIEVLIARATHSRNLPSECSLLLAARK